MRPITVIGGGLAGLTLGVGLRRRGVPVTIWEAGHYPRHRVCGEFISGRGQEVLRQLELDADLRGAGAIEAKTAAVFLGKSSSPVRTLTPPAWCLSRFELDALLARRFRECGGDLREGQHREDTEGTEGLVQATGRRLRPEERGWRWYGLKVHARRVPLNAALELHTLRHGYVGLCRLANDWVNICGLFRHGAESPAPALTWQQRLQGPAGTPLHDRLAKAAFDEASFRSVAGLCLHPVRASRSSQCCIGDALTLIPPATGNGMSMAFEAAALAVGPLTAYSRRDLCWAEATQAIAAACDVAFARRLAWAKVLHLLMFAPALRGPWGRLLLGSEWVWNLLFGRTR